MFILKCLYFTLTFNKYFCWVYKALGWQLTVFQHNNVTFHCFYWMSCKSYYCSFEQTDFFFWLFPQFFSLVFVYSGFTLLCPVVVFSVCILPEVCKATWIYVFMSLIIFRKYCFYSILSSPLQDSNYMLFYELAYVICSFWSFLHFDLCASTWIFSTELSSILSILSCNASNL